LLQSISSETQMIEWFRAIEKNPNAEGIPLLLSIIGNTEKRQMTKFEEFKKQALLTDQQIKEYCERTIEKRLKEKDSFAQLGFMIYGDIKLSKEEQVQKGFEYYSKKRDELKEWLSEFKNINVNKLYFGLEHVINFK